MLFHFADKIFLLSLKQYGKSITKIPPQTPVISLPIFSNLKTAANKQSAINLRKAFAKDWPFVIGTYGSFKKSPDNSHTDKALGLRIQSAGELSESAISAHLLSCDLLVQSYYNGVSTSRTSVMAGLHHGIPVVTFEGSNTEQIWRQSEAVALVPWPSISQAAERISQLLDSPEERTRLANTGKNLYHMHFCVEKAVETLEQA